MNSSRNLDMIQKNNFQNWIILSGDNENLSPIGFVYVLCFDTYGRRVRSTAPSANVAILS